MQRFIAMLFFLVLAACGQPAETTPTLAPAVPYQSLVSTPTPTIILGAAEIILPEPTSHTYTVVQGDTLISIAQRNGVTVEALQAANPGLPATALSVGITLVIPAGDQASAEPTPTPAELPVCQARCWPETSGGAWCFALVQNTYGETLENLSAQFTLLDSSGQELTSQVVYGFLDILLPGASMPLAAHFAPPVQPDASVRVQVLTAIRLLPGDTRYLPVKLENTMVSVEASGRTANVSGRILLTGEEPANVLWVLASAYDQDGNVIGVRRWEPDAAPGVIRPVSFYFQVSSLGPAIARVEFLAEARP
jgi:murein DD-endopeptidase MepM/ murein hydrolase activator NlpD